MQDSNEPPPSPDPAPAATTPNWAAIGHPVHLFIDTSVFERLRFPFQLPLMQALVARAEAGDIRLVMPEIILRELREHAASAVQAAKDAHARFRKDAAILRNLPKHALAPVFADIDWEAIAKTIEKGLDRFLKAAKTETVTIAADDAPEVFDDYFARKPPFGAGKKKSEFPDAFAIKALLRFADDEDVSIAVVSGDGDWEAVCKTDDRLIWCPSLEAVIDHSQKAQSAQHERIRAALADHRQELEAAIVKSFADRGFYWDSEDGYDGDVEETYDEEVESLEWSIVGTEGRWADLAADASITFKASATFPDPDMSYRDDETKDIVSMGNKHVGLSATVTVPVTVRVNTRTLEKGELEFDDLTVNGNDDIWFAEDSIEDQGDDWSE